MNVIDDLKKKHALLQIDYDTLTQKLNSYASSSYIIENRVGKRKEKKNAGIGYNACPPPLHNVMSSPLNDDPITAFKVKTPLTAEPIDVKIDKNKGSEGCTTGVEKVDGLIEECD